MRSQKKRSAKPLSTPAVSEKQLEATYTFYLDNDLGRHILPELLKKAGLSVEIHADHFRPEESDHVWIEGCAKRNWVIITGDKKIEKTPISLRTVFEKKAKIIFIEENNSKAILWAAALIVSKGFLLRMVHQNAGPFFIDLSRNTEKLIKGLRKVESPDVAQKQRRAHLPKADAIAS